jgi:hypothetical protein
MGVASGQTWARGVRGWGSAEQNASGGQNITKYQQNPANTPVEAAADMFLNWVYRRFQDAAPTGIASPFDPLVNDDPAPASACNYEADGDWEGFRNIGGDGNPEPTNPQSGNNPKSGNVRYWWMEGTLGVIFQNRGWK